MNIAVQYLSDTDGILTVAFFTHGALISIVSGECEFMERQLIRLRECMRAYNKDVENI